MWAPVDFAALAWLPRPGDRPYTQVEALFSLQADYWHDRPASVMGFAGQWGWHRRRVRDFMAQVGVEIVGQVGRRPGKLRPSNGPANGPTNGPATAQQVFRDFGQIGYFENKSGPSNGPANVSEVAHTYQQDIKNEQDTTPPIPPEEQQVAGDGQIKEYVRLANKNGKAKDPAGLERYLLSRGLTPSHLQQLHAWKKAEEDKWRRDDEIALQAEKQKTEQENERERVEAAWNSFLALPKKVQERLTSDYLSSLPSNLRRDYDPKKDKWQACLKYWLPEKIDGEIAQC